MNKATFIIGPPGSGKTTLALEMVAGRSFRTVFPSDSLELFASYCCDSSVEVLIFEEVTLETFPILHNLIEIIQDRKKDVIICSQSVHEEDLPDLPHIEVIDLS
jgi:stage III sporulation protein SpoIIIAA